MRLETLILGMGTHLIGATGSAGWISCSVAIRRRLGAENPHGSDVTHLDLACRGSERLMPRSNTFPTDRCSRKSKGRKRPNPSPSHPPHGLCALCGIGSSPPPGDDFGVVSARGHTHVDCHETAATKAQIAAVVGRFTRSGSTPTRSPARSEPLSHHRQPRPARRRSLRFAARSGRRHPRSQPFKLCRAR